MSYSRTFVNSTTSLMVISTRTMWIFDLISIILVITHKKAFLFYWFVWNQVKQWISKRNAILYTLHSTKPFCVNDNTKIITCSLISHGLIFDCVFKRRFSPMPFLPWNLPWRITSLDSLTTAGQIIPKLVMELFLQSAYPIRMVRCFSSCTIWWQVHFSQKT